MRRKRSVVTFPGKKQKVWNRRRSFAFAALLCILFLLSVAVAYYWHCHSLALERDHYNGEVQKMEDENDELKEEIVRLQDQEYIEFLARRYLDLARPGED
ncbi:MAG: hypothetical protein GX887_08480 [Firmicutes bacterium]|nr:hypothetical protein [Bacillota bacterium]